MTQASIGVMMPLLIGSLFFQMGLDQKSINDRIRVISLLAMMLVSRLAMMLVSGLAAMLVSGLTTMLVSGLAMMLISGLLENKNDTYTFGSL